MITVYKYPIGMHDVQVLELPNDFQVLHVVADGMEQLCLWCKVSTTVGKTTRRIYVVGTGNPFPFGAKSHLGSAVMPSGRVWHVFLGD